MYVYVLVMEPVFDSQGELLEHGENLAVYAKEEDAYTALKAIKSTYMRPRPDYYNVEKHKLI